MKKPYKAFPIDDPDPNDPTQREMYLPSFQVRLGHGHGNRSPRFDAIVDSGSPWCIFRADLGRMIGIDITKTNKTYPLGGVISGPRDTMYIHKVKIFVESDWVIEVMAGFVEKLAVTGILGRNGFFTNFKTTFDHSTNPATVEIERFHIA
jgi:hypothetical protein